MNMNHSNSFQDPNVKLEMATSSFLPAIIKPKTPIPDVCFNTIAVIYTDIDF